jgi:ATP/maltotriose-dependent transcriptional regulator MalT
MLRASLALFWESNWARAEQDLREAISLVEKSDDLRLWFLFALYLGPEFTILPGVLDLLEHFCEVAMQYAGPQVTPLRLCVEDAWACIHLRRGRLLQAVEIGKNALQVKEQLGGYTFLGVNACLAVASAYLGIGNFLAAEEYLEKSARLVAESEINRALTGGGLYPKGKLLWLEGRYDEARLVYQQIADLEIRLPMLEVLQKMLGGLLEIALGRYKQAEIRLIEAVHLQSKEPVSEVYGSARLLLAYLYQRWDRSQEALGQIETILATCERDHTPGIILQDMPFAAPALRLAVKLGRHAGLAARLLEQMGLTLAEEQGKPDVVTVRQLEILRLMEAGYSNQAIADTLVLSLATVKSHVVHIMNRLGASSRLEAVALARQAGLL